MILLLTFLGALLVYIAWVVTNIGDEVRAVHSHMHDVTMVSGIKITPVPPPYRYQTRSWKRQSIYAGGQIR